MQRILAWILRLSTLSHFFTHQREIDVGGGREEDITTVNYVADSI